jgi:hypothetical protein
MSGKWGRRGGRRGWRPFTKSEKSLNGIAPTKFGAENKLAEGLASDKFRFLGSPIIAIKTHPKS